MNTRRWTLTLGAASLAALLLWSVQATAYSTFSGANNCDQCHTDWTGATHTLHSDQFSCGTCHSVDPVTPTQCIACHNIGDLFDLHGPLTDGDGYQCGYCHEGVGARPRSWTGVKNDFR
jgi:hypothetical protein